MNTLGTDVNLDMNIQEMKGAYVLDDNDYIIYMTTISYTTWKSSTSR